MDYSTEITTPERASSTPHLREKLVEAATEKAAKELIIERIGQARFDKALPLIEKNILPMSDNYFSVVKPGPLSESPSGTTIKVSFRVNESELVRLLHRNNLESGNSDAKGSPRESNIRIRIYPMSSLAMTEQIREALHRSRGITSIKERLVEKTQIVYEAETSMALKDLVANLKSDAQLTSVGKLEIIEQDPEIWLKVHE